VNKNSEIERLIEDKISELHKVKRWFENERLERENAHLRERCSALEERLAEVESGRVTPMSEDSFDPEVTVYEVERRYVLAAVKHHGGDKRLAANDLGITIKTLYNKLHEYGADDLMEVVK
jgi:DNA-binding NtrC family response regulator